MTQRLPNSNAPFKIISASRRTDMVACDPGALAARLEEKAPPETTHSLVLWTKNPRNILSNVMLRNKLLQYDQLFLHLSITGLGGTPLEPQAPTPDKVFSMLPSLIDFLRGPERISIRFDPIVHFEMPDGSFVCNLDFFDLMAPILAHHNLRHVVASWVQIYGKVNRRLQKLGICPASLSEEKRRQEAAWLQRQAQRYGLELQGCCVPGLPRSSCIDAKRLNQLHPHGHVAETRKASGQRLLCGCSKSLDIGWYSSCVHGCVYCYGNPRFYNFTTAAGVSYEYT